MKIKFILIIIGSAVIGSSITVAVIQSRGRSGQRNRAVQSQNNVATAMSNYTHTFKLNTNPPLWPDTPKK
jgi:hypothetical protein